MGTIAESFCNPPWVVKNHALHGNNEIKNVSMLRRTYVLKGEVDAKFSDGNIWNLFQGDTLLNNASKFCR